MHHDGSIRDDLKLPGRAVAESIYFQRPAYGLKSLLGESFESRSVACSGSARCDRNLNVNTDVCIDLNERFGDYR